jgi:hypothetical protein
MRRPGPALRGAGRPGRHPGRAARTPTAGQPPARPGSLSNRHWRAPPGEPLGCRTAGHPVQRHPLKCVEGLHRVPLAGGGRRRQPSRHSSSGRPGRDETTPARLTNARTVRDDYFGQICDDGPDPAAGLRHRHVQPGQPARASPCCVVTPSYRQNFSIAGSIRSTVAVSYPSSAGSLPCSATVEILEYGFITPLTPRGQITAWTPSSTHGLASSPADPTNIGRPPCVAATQPDADGHRHDVVSVAGSSPESCKGARMGRGTARASPDRARLARACALAPP